MSKIALCRVLSSPSSIQALHTFSPHAISSHDSVRYNTREVMIEDAPFLPWDNSDYPKIRPCSLPSSTTKFKDRGPRFLKEDLLVAFLTLHRNGRLYPSNGFKVEVRGIALMPLSHLLGNELCLPWIFGYKALAKDLTSDTSRCKGVGISQGSTRKTARTKSSPLCNRASDSAPIHIVASQPTPLGGFLQERSKSSPISNVLRRNIPSL